MSLTNSRHSGQMRRGFVNRFTNGFTGGFKDGFTNGFTLIELVMVIGIIAIIVVFSVSSYSSYRKSITLSLAVDSLQSAVKQIQQQARSGKVLADGTTPCYGLRLEDGQPVQFVTAVYQKGSEKSNAAAEQACLQEKLGGEISLMNGVNVTGVTGATGAGSSINMRVFAIPPRGELVVSGLDPNASTIHFRLQFGSDSSKWIGVKMSLPFGILQRDQL